MKEQIILADFSEIFMVNDLMLHTLKPISFVLQGIGLLIGNCSFYDSLPISFVLK